MNKTVMGPDRQLARRSVLCFAAAAAVGAGAVSLSTAHAADSAAGNLLGRSGRPEDPAVPREPVTGALAGEDFKQLPHAAATVALTFDCGGTPDGAREILETLRRGGVPASFFMTGQFAEAHPALCRHIASRYPVGNHSMTHRAFDKLTLSERADEVRLGAAAIEHAIGRPTEPFFRFPYGRRNKGTIAEVNQAGYVCAGWTVDTAGWRGTSGGATTATAVERVKKALKPGAIVLMHVGTTSSTDPSTVDATALPHLIAAIQDAGYGFTTLLDFLR